MAKLVECCAGNGWWTNKARFLLIFIKFKSERSFSCFNIPHTQTVNIACQKIFFVYIYGQFMDSTFSACFVQVHHFCVVIDLTVHLSILRYGNPETLFEVTLGRLKFFLSFLMYLPKFYTTCV